MAIVKFSSKEINESRKELLKDISKQEVRKQLDKYISYHISNIINKKIDTMSKSSLTYMIERAYKKGIDKKVSEALREKRISIQKITKKELFEKINVDIIITQVKDEVKKEVLKKLGK